jgi:hypothetical protein
MGTWPYFRAQNSLIASSYPPLNTYNQKIRYKMAHDRRKILTTFADRVAVRDYVTERIGKSFLTEIYAVLDSAGLDFFDIASLPRNFVIKATHGSGGVIIVSEYADPAFLLPENLDQIGWDRFLLHPSSFDWNQCKSVLRKLLNLNYSYIPGTFPEWAYKDVPPKILIEEYLCRPHEPLIEMKVFTFNGVCECILVQRNLSDDITRDLYSSDWEKLSVNLGFLNSSVPMMRPENLEEIIRISEALALDHDHVRVDLYCFSDKVIFGELTNYNSGGRQFFSPETFDLKIGRSWKPELLY